MRSDKIWRETENKSMIWWEYRFLNILLLTFLIVGSSLEICIKNNVDYWKGKQQPQTEAGGVTKQPRKQHPGGDACRDFLLLWTASLAVE